jgi:hypothetical protein
MKKWFVAAIAVLVIKWAFVVWAFPHLPPGM